MTIPAAIQAPTNEPYTPAEHGRNPGTALDLGWLRGVQVNRSAVERRALTLPGRRTVKKAFQAAWLLKAVTCIDLTTLAGDDTPIDATLEELLQRVVSTPDVSGRAAASKAVQDYVTDQAYILPLFEEPQVYALAPHVNGFDTEAVARPSFYSVYLTQSHREVGAEQ